ncbi:MAG: hypothetical protein LBJ35_03530 [Spirochaetaceae bacterium]|nr:hypothetical protein [Spirochaetaceae bacterium]
MRDSRDNSAERMETRWRAGVRGLSKLTCSEYTDSARGKSVDASGNMDFGLSFMSCRVWSASRFLAEVVR